MQDVSEQAAAAVGAGQAGTAGLADSYLAASTTLVRGAATAPAGVSPAMRESLRHGVTGPEVQARVAQEFRWQIFRGLDPDSALGVAMNRARESASQDLNLAFQRQVADFTDTSCTSLGRYQPSNGAHNAYSAANTRSAIVPRPDA